MWKWMIFFAVAGILWLIYEWYQHCAIQYNTTCVEFHSSNLQETMKICLISDLHNNKKNCLAIRRRVQEFSPDCIFLAGDMVNKHKTVNSNAVELIKMLADCAPVYYSMGNHEEVLRTYFPKEWESYLSQLPESVIFLDNECVPVNKQASVYVSGLSLPEIYYKKGKLYKNTEGLPKISVPVQGFHILLAHHPEYASCYELYRASLILSGHLHGGLLRLPFIGGVVSPRLQLPCYDSGMKALSEDCKLFISRGLGSHTIPLRFFNRVEINFLVLEGNEQNDK